MKIHQHLLQILVREEIERLVADASQKQGFLRAGEHAYRLAKQFPNSGIPDSELVNSIIAEAAHAGVAVEIYQPRAKAA
jgi:hypothetical protein